MKKSKKSQKQNKLHPLQEYIVERVDELNRLRTEILSMAGKLDEDNEGVMREIANDIEDVALELDTFKHDSLNEIIESEKNLQEQVYCLEDTTEYAPTLLTLQDESKARIAKRLCENLTEAELEEVEMMFAYKLGSNYKVSCDPVPHAFNKLLITP